ncbi:hypothetical protein [Acetonema longum]|uniref:Uncharacterized protein n=1 Tax=Acetonema longum DSM 6540 TaxID=1009370 RepID=F7NIQ6_9FIRM|nr:hypothetical protein [Acetonema longum]EGO64029.1 hypothetical protein ALO_09794 [Acetonema longum DSM 6540]
MAWRDGQQQTLAAVFIGLLLARQKKPAELNQLLHFLLTICSVAGSSTAQAGDWSDASPGAESDRHQEQNLQSQMDTLKQSLGRLESRVQRQALGWKPVCRPCRK